MLRTPNSVGRYKSTRIDEGRKCYRSGCVGLAQAHPLANPPAIRKTAFRRTWSSDGPPYPFGRWFSEYQTYVQELRMGRTGQHFDLFDSIFDRVKAVTTKHIVYACRM